jgi:hypothetical protein
MHEGDQELYSRKPLLINKIIESVKLSETDWQKGLALELERQRPQGEPNESEKNIDWWHFTAYVNDLSIIDKNKTEELISSPDKEKAIQDFTLLRDSNQPDKWWQLPIYAARLKDLGWFEQSFNNDDQEHIFKEIEEMRDKQEFWHLFFYISRLSVLDRNFAKGLIKDEDWEKIPKIQQELIANPDKNYLLLTIELENNLKQIDPEKGQKFFNTDHVAAALKRAEELKDEGNWWLATQYLAAGLTAEKKQSVIF